MQAKNVSAASARQGPREAQHERAESLILLMIGEKFCHLTVENIKPLLKFYLPWKVLSNLNTWDSLIDEKLEVSSPHRTEPE